MKKIKKLASLLLALVMVMGLSVTAFAQEVDSGKNGTGSITVSNAAKGETYAAYLLFEATLGKNGEVAYKGTVPNDLTNYFEETSTGSGYVQAKPAAFNTVTYYTDATKNTLSESNAVTDYWTGSGGMSEGLKAALTTWKGTATASATAVSDGSALTFTNLVLGYYVVTTSQGSQLISVDTTNPNVTVTDKNTTTPTATKTVDEISYSIGDTITYTARFDTANYVGEDQVKSYTISDTLPEFLSNVAITSVKIVQTNVDADKSTYPDADLSSSYTSFTNKKIVIPWVADDGTTSLYKNGSVITITYTAVLTSTVNVNEDNTNTVTITPNKDTTGTQPFNESYSDDAVINTYAAALKKTDGTNALSGAKFAFNGLAVTKIADGIYQVSAYDPTSTTQGTEMEVDSNGKLYIIGLANSVSLTGYETVAPDGYNKLTGSVTLTPQKLTSEVIHTSGTRYYDEKGNLVSVSSATTTEKTVTANLSDLDESAVEVVNQAGSLLPSTGGMGTTLFYVIGGILVIGAAVLLITRRRMNSAK